MKNWFSKSTLVLLFGAALGYAATSSGIATPSIAIDLPESQAETAETRSDPADTVASADSCSDGLSRNAQLALAAHNLTVAAKAQADGKKPNILIIWGDDVGMWNISAYHRGMMGGSTPNIDRIAKEGMIFMDHYGHASCTAGRASFILGQYRTILNDKYKDKSGYGVYADGMMELDDGVGELLDLVKTLGVDDNTIVMFSTDNGAPCNSWPDGGNQPFHGEKGAGAWEGSFRVPMLVKWKNKIPAGTATGEFMTMEDWIPTLMSWVGQKTITEDLRIGKEIAGKKYKVHLDGHDQSDILLNQGKTKRKDFYYFTENTFHGMRYGDWKLLFIDQKEWFRAEQIPLTSPFIINLKLDPFERFIHARGYDEWAENRSWLFGPAGGMIAQFVGISAQPEDRGCSSVRY